MLTETTLSLGYLGVRKQIKAASIVHVARSSGGLLRRCAGYAAAA